MAKKFPTLISTGYALFFKPVEVATTSCQYSARGTYTGMLGGVVRMQMIQLTMSYVRLVPGLHVQTREPHEHW